MPRVIELTEKEMHVRYCGDVSPENCFTPGALYSDGIIFLPQDFSVGSTRQLGVLLHEFVHHLQHIGALDICLGVMERQSYAVQELWLEQNGLEPKVGDDFPGPMLRMMIEQCAEDGF